MTMSSSRNGKPFQTVLSKWWLCSSLVFTGHRGVIGGIFQSPLWPMRQHVWFHSKFRRRVWPCHRRLATFWDFSQHFGWAEVCDRTTTRTTYTSLALRGLGPRRADQGLPPDLFRGSRSPCDAGEGLAAHTARARVSPLPPGTTTPHFRGAALTGHGVFPPNY